MADSDIVYSEINEIFCSEFTPSRVTRESSNPFLQEHHKWKQNCLARGAKLQDPGRQPDYVQLQFDDNTQNTLEPEQNYTNVISRYKSNTYPKLKISPLYDNVAVDKSSGVTKYIDLPPQQRTRSTAFSIPDSEDSSDANDDAMYMNVRTEDGHCRSISPSARMTGYLEKLQQKQKEASSKNNKTSKTLPIPRSKSAVHEARPSNEAVPAVVRPNIDVTSIVNAKQQLRHLEVSNIADEKHGTFSATYLGGVEVDCYTNCVDYCAKEIADAPTINSLTVCICVSPECIRLTPSKTGPLFKGFSVPDIMTVSRCSMDNRIVGIVLWKPSSIPFCHMLRCSDQFVANAMIDAITQAMESHFCTCDESERTPPDSDHFNFSSEEEEEVSTASSEDFFLSGLQSLQQSFSVLYIGSVKVCKQQTVNDVMQRGLSEKFPSQAKSVTMCLSVNQVRLIDGSFNKGAMLAKHKTNRIKAVEIGQTDHRYMGYIVEESSGQLAGHVYRCANYKSVTSIISFLQKSCQISYKEEETQNDVNPDSKRSDSPLLARLHSTSVTQKIQSYVLSISPSSSMTDLNKATETAEDHIGFQATYVGSATLKGPFTPHAIIQALSVFDREGVTGGMAAIRKNVISMMVSRQGINLMDKTRKLFINRNYPKKQILGCAMHPYNSSYFAFATTRPGFPDQLKVHVFSQVDTCKFANEILDSIQSWLQIVVPQ